MLRKVVTMETVSQLSDQGSQKLDCDFAKQDLLKKHRAGSKTRVEILLERRDQMWPRQQVWVVPGAGVAHHHGLLNSEVRQQHVVLHDVARDLPEAAQIPGHAIDKDCPFHASLPAKTRRQVPVSQVLQAAWRGKQERGPPSLPPSWTLPRRTIHHGNRMEHRDQVM